MEKIILFVEDNLHSERTRVTLRDTWDNKNSDVLSMRRETERILQDVELWPNSIRESQVAGRGFTRTSNTCKELKNSYMMLGWSRSIISLPKSLSKRSTRRFSYMSIRDRYQNNSIIHTLHFRNNQNDTLRCIIFGIWWGSRPDDTCNTYHETSRAIVCLNWGSRSESTNYLKKKQFRDDLREAQMAYIGLTQLERVHTKASSKIIRSWRSVSQRRMLREPRTLHSQWMMESQLMEQVPVTKIKMDMEWWSLRIFQGVSHPGDELKKFFVKMVSTEFFKGFVHM